MFNFKKEMFPQSKNPPIGMLDMEGELQTDEATIKEVALNEYKKY